MSLTTISVKEETRKALAQIKLNLDFETMDDVVAYLLKSQEAKALKTLEAKKA